MNVLTPPIPREKMDHPVAQSESQIAHYLSGRTTFFTWAMHLRHVLKYIQGNAVDAMQVKAIHSNPRDRLEIRIQSNPTDQPRFYTVTFGHGAYCLVEGTVSEESTLR